MTWRKLPREKLFYTIICSLVIIQLIFLFNRGAFTDEQENLVGSWLVSQGYVPYLDYFTHHAPALYYFGALLAWGPLPFQTPRIIVILCLIGLMVIAYKQKSSVRSSLALWLIAYAILTPALFLHMYLASSLAVILLAMLIILSLNHSPNMGSHAQTFWKRYALIAPILIWSSIAYAVPLFFIAIMGLQTTLRALIGKQLKKVTYWLIGMAVALLLPPFAYAIFGHLSLFIFDVFTFNQRYYYPLRLMETQASNPIATGLINTLASHYLQVFLALINIIAVFLQTIIHISLKPSLQFPGLVAITFQELFHHLTLDMLAVVYLFGSCFMLLKKGRWTKAILLFLTLSSLRLRDNELFHLAPYYLLCLLCFLILSLQNQTAKSIKGKLILFPLVIGSLSVIVGVYQKAGIPAKGIISSEKILQRQAVITNSQPGDLILNLSGNTTIFYRTDLKPVAKTLYTFPWIEAVPLIHQAQLDALTQSLPAIVVLPSKDASLSADYKKALIENYFPFNDTIYLSKSNLP